MPVYQDEVHFQVQTTITTAWYKKGSAPRLKSFPGREKVSYSGFVVPDTGTLFVAKPAVFTYETTINSIREFLKAIPISEGKKFAIIMDNAPWHKKAVRAVEENAGGKYDDITGKAVFVKLPPYSPDLNTIEQVWRITRRENTHNVFFKSRAELEEVVDEAFSKWSKPNSQLCSLCSFIRKY